MDSEPEPTLSELLHHLSPVDLVLVEGFKRDPSYPKLEVWRSDNGKPLLCPEDPTIDDVPAIGRFVIRHFELMGPGV